MLLLRVDHEDGVGQPLEVLDAAEVPLELLPLVAQADRLLLGETFHGLGLLHLRELAQTQQPAADRAEVGEHPAQPSVVHERHVDPGGVVRNDFLGLLLRPDEQDDAAATAEPLDEGVGFLEPGQRSLEVDDVDPGTLPEEVPLHLRVPPSRLVAEVHARLEELPPGDDRHVCSFRLCPPLGSPR